MAIEQGGGAAQVTEEPCPTKTSAQAAADPRGELGSGPVGSIEGALEHRNEWVIENS